jgi:hypothetical protein
MLLRLPRVQNGSGGSAKLRYEQFVALEAAGSNPVIHPTLNKDFTIEMPHQNFPKETLG